MIEATFSCALFSGKSDEIVLAATEVGTPAGDRVTKEIGPAGSTFSSADGRLTLTVPQNAVAENTTFTIQPITNKSINGIGNAYRLGPDGTTFKIPLELSVRYEERDLEGTAAEALTIAFQDSERKWHLLEPAKLDTANRSITFSTTHFTDFSFLARLRLEPSQATLRVGQSMQIRLVGCDEASQRTNYCLYGSRVLMEWYADVGTVTNGTTTATYTAPPTKPRPNIATISIPYDVAGEGGPWLFPGQLPERRRGMFIAHITIVDGGYRATGSSGGLTFSGTVCSLDQPFTIKGQSQLTFKFDFTPSNGTGGNVAIGGGGMGITIGNSSGSYTVEGIDSGHPRIALSGSFTGTYPGVGTASGLGTRYIDLVPLDTNECD